MSAAALAYLTFIIAQTLIFGIEQPGYASLMSVMLFSNGLLFIGIGVIGEYLARIFDEVKGRPLYLVAERQGFEAAARATEPAETKAPRAAS